MTYPVPAVLPITPVSRLAFHYRAEDASLVAVSGQALSFTRNATATPADQGGTTRTVVASQPAWQHEDWDGDATRESLTLLLGTSDEVYANVPILPTALTWSLEFVERGAIGVASACVGYLGNSGNTGARLWVDSTGTYYRARHHNGTAEVTSTLAAAPTSGQRVQLRVTLGADGKVQIHQAINQGAESSATQSGTNTLAAAWSDTRLYLNSTGTTNKGAQALLRQRLALGGAFTAAQMGVAW